MLRWKTLIVLVSGMQIAVQSHAATIRVDKNSPGNGPGTAIDWSDAWKHPQDGIDNASPGDLVHIADGTYIPDKTSPFTDRTASFILKTDVQVIGGFAGNGAADPDATGFVTVFSGDLSNNDNFVQGSLPGTAHQYNNYGDNSYHVVFVPNTVTAFSTHLPGHLKDVTIRGGNADDTSGAGGGILIDTGAIPHIRDCIIRENRADSDGGGVHIGLSSGAVLRNCTIQLNHSSFFGGGVRANTSNEVVIINSTLEKNSAVVGAGAYLGRTSPVKLINTHFRGNAASVNGGGALVSGTQVPQAEVTNCKFTGNNAASGGGLRIEGVALTMHNCTFSTNSASGSGGAYVQDNSSATTPTVRNCIFWNDSATTSDPEIYLQSGTINVTYSDVQQSSGTYTGTGNKNIDPSFVDPNGPDNVANNGDDDWRLACGSQCINTGDTNASAAPPTGSPVDGEDVDGDSDFTEKTPDLDLNLRIFGVEIDMGAYEKPQQTATCFASIAPSPCPDAVVDTDDLLLVINSWGSCAAPCPADLAGSSGVVDTDDLLVIINNWGACEGASQGECEDICELAFPDDMEAMNNCIEQCAGR